MSLGSEHMAKVKFNLSATMYIQIKNEHGKNLTRKGHLYYIIHRIIFFFLFPICILFTAMMLEVIAA